MSAIQHLLTAALVSVILELAVILAFSLSLENTSILPRGDRDAFLMSLREESEEFLRKHNLEIAYLIEHVSDDGTYTGGPVLSGEWVSYGFTRNTGRAGSVDFYLSNPRGEFFGKAVPSGLMKMTQSGSELYGGNVFVCDSAGIFIAHSDPLLAGQRAPGWLNLNSGTLDGTRAEVKSPEGRRVTSILINSNRWTIGWYGSPRKIFSTRRFVHIVLFAISVLLLTIISLLHYLIRRHLIAPLKILTVRSGISAGGSAVIVREPFSIRDIDSLAASIYELMDKAGSREVELKKTTASGTGADGVKIESHERDGSLQLLTGSKEDPGTMISGVAHDINTPLSIGVTAASFLNEQSRNIYREWESRLLTQENLEQFLKDSGEASGIIQKNLDHAARILNSLKQVTTDRQLDEIREFELGTYVKDIVLSLKHRLMPANHRIEIETDGILMVNTRPGAITAILDNLITNSVVHGFSRKSDGRITIGVREDGSDAVLTISDNGRGLTGEEVRRIMDQSFTSRRPGGEPVTGLNIVFQLAAEKLRGQIEISPPSGGGAGFSVRFPKDTGGTDEQ